MQLADRNKEVGELQYLAGNLQYRIKFLEEESELRVSALSKLQDQFCTVCKIRGLCGPKLCGTKLFAYLAKG